MSCHSAHRVPIRESGHWGYAWFPLHCRSSWAGAQPPVLSGLDRPGLHHSTNPFDELDIYVATRNPDRTWAEAVNLGLNGAYADSGGSNIVTANRNPDGTWGPAADPGPG